MAIRDYLMSGLPRDFCNKGLEARAASLYSSALPYHNFEHVKDTLRAADTIVERAHVEHIRIDSEVVYYALLFHDAGYHEDHRALGFATKEAYSADLAATELAAIGIPRARIEKTQSAILATERDAFCVSADQKAVRAADLSGLAAPYPEFLIKSLNLKREYEYLHATQLDWVGWQTISREVLGYYLSQEIRLTSYFYNERGESAFHSAVRENLRRLLAEPTEPRH